MRKFLMIIVALFATVSGFAQGIEFSEDSYAQALKRAKKEKKAVFIDIYTSWCGPCKQMAKTVFMSSEVGKLYNENFICLKFDAEKTEDGKMLIKKFEVPGYPTMLFVNEKGELVYRIVGGRTEKKFLEEGEQAVRSYKNMPELVKMDKIYAKGGKAVTKDFLVKYYDIRNTSSLDCGQLLVSYFNMLSDDEILMRNNFEKISVMSVYDSALTGRILKLLSDNQKKMPAKDFADFNKGCAKYLSTTIRSITKENDEAKFEDMLEMRRRYMTIDGNKPSVASASLGGGTILMPEETIRMEYYLNKKMDDKFVAVMNDYTERYIIIGKEEFNKMVEMERGSREKMEEARKNGDTHAENQMKQLIGMMRTFAGVDIYYNSVTLLNYIEKYDSMYKDNKDETYKQKLIKWYRELYSMHVSAKSANSIADKLVDMGQKDMAIEFLKAGIEEGKDAFGVEDADLEKSNDLIKELSK